MKKVFLLIALVATASFTGCSKDDDENKCATCSIDFLGTALVTEACDNGDGTVTLTVNGESQVVSGDELEGATPAEFVQALEDGCL